eukprot:COSAG02_NODE_2446_length_8839_cov_6.263501_4_plen_407_part_00
MRPAAGRAALLLRLAGLAALAPSGDAGKPCGSNADCNNHGQCDTAVTPAVCRCDAHWEGEYCSVDALCKDVKCNHGTCHEGKCSCENGWSGTSCAHATGCDNKPCHPENGGTCTPHGGGYSCDCPKGYTGDNCQWGPCKPQGKAVDCHHGTCEPQGSGYVCTCKAGWQGTDCNERKPCRKFPSILHSSGCDGNHVYGDNCTVKCDEGWTGGTPDAPFTCKADGTYDGQLQCDPVTCSAPNPQQSTGCSTKLTYGSDSTAKCLAICNDGWTGGPKQKAGFECQPDGRKQQGKIEGSLDCQRVRCGAYPGSPQSHATTHGKKCTDMHFEDTCTVTCEDCYSAGTKSVTFTCTNSGKETAGVFDNAEFSCGRESRSFAASCLVPLASRTPDRWPVRCVAGAFVRRRGHV